MYISSLKPSNRAPAPFDPAATLTDDPFMRLSCVSWTAWL
jgi:hypothetical protein